MPGVDALAVPATILAALAVLVLPGLPGVLALRLRPLTAAALLAPLSLFLITLAAELGRILSVPWTPLSALVLGLLLGAVLWLLGRRRPALAPADAEPEETSGRLLPGLAVGGGLALGITVLLARSLRMMGSIDALSQTYDNVFHLNAVRHILRMHDASAFTVGGMTSLPGEEAYYPALWHQAASLVVQLSGQEIILASNVLMLLVGCVIWPLGLMALVRACTPVGPTGLFAAGALAGVTAAFPLSLMSWGILLPYLLSIGMMPLVVLGVAQLAGLTPAGPERLRPLPLAVVLVAGCGAAAAAHGQGVFVGLALGVPILLAGAVAATVRARRGESSWRAAVVLALLGGATAVLGVVGSILVRPPQSSAVWTPNASLVEAIGQVGSLSPNATPTFVPLGIVVAGCLLAVALSARSRWILAPYAVAALFGIATRATPEGDLRYLLTGVWYSDNYRASAILPVIAVPVLAVGLDVIVRAVAARVPALRDLGSPRRPLIGAVAVVASVAMVLTFSLVSRAAAVNMWYLKQDWHGDQLLTEDELTLLRRLPELVPEDAVIATNAWNGSSLAYAVSDRQVLNTFMGFEAEPEVHLLNAELDEAQRDPEVCDAVEELDVEYALDFGPQELLGRSATYTGLNEISETGAAEVIAQEGDARLLRLLPCRMSDGSMTG